MECIRRKSSRRSAHTKLLLPGGAVALLALAGAVAVGQSRSSPGEAKPARPAAPATIAVPAISGPYDLSDVPEATAPGQVGLSPFRRVEVERASHERTRRS